MDWWRQPAIDPVWQRSPSACAEWAQFEMMTAMDHMAKRERDVSLRAPQQLHILAPILVIAAFSVSSGAWLLKDQTVWPWDQAWYAETALNLRYATTGGFEAWVTAMVNAMGSKPPLLSWLAQAFVPASHLLGSVESALLLLNFICQIAILGLVYLTSRSSGASVLASLVGVVATGGSSLFMGVTHQFLVEPLQMFCAAALAWTALNSTAMPMIRVISLLLMLTAISFLAKSSSFTFVAPFVFYVVVALAIDRGSARRPATPLDRFIAVLAVLAAGAATAWYAVNWKAMVQHFKNATSADVALLYGSLGSIPDKLVYWFKALGLALAPHPWIALALTAAIVVALAITWAKVLRVPPRQWLATSLHSKALFSAVLFGQVVVTIYGLATQINEETRFLAPTIPIIGVLSAWALSVIGLTALTAAFLVMAIANAAFAIAYVHHADPFKISPSVWLKPYSVDGKKERLMQTVGLTCPVANRYVIVGVEYPDFNANSASFYSAQHRRTSGRRCYYTSFGYAESSMPKALKRLDALDVDFVATIKPERQVSPADSFNQIAKPAIEHLRNDERFDPVPGAPDEVEIFRRRR
jgi:hypothetical protein